MKRDLLVPLSTTVMVLAMVLAASAPFALPMRAAPAKQSGSITILSPRPGTVVTGNTVAVEIAVKDFTINCAWAGKAPQAGLGHWHLLLDGGLVNMECATAVVLSMQDVAAGKHTIEAVLATNDHTAVAGKSAVATTTFIYKPAHRLPALAAYKAPGKPSISILAPRSGAAVGEHFQVVLGWTNVRPSCALLGKPNVPGYGHWHLFIDSLTKGLATMLAMGCTHTYTVFTDGLTRGRHTLYAVLADDLHAAITPAEVAAVTINVTSGAASTSTNNRGAASTSGASPAAQRWLSWNAATHTATLTLIANYNNTLGGFNFNGYGNGKMVISVPVGAHVKVIFSNKGSLAHSAVITPWSDRNSTSGSSDAFAGSSSPDPATGVTAGTTQTFSFVATKVGKDALVCAVHGHAAAGMWDVFMVTKGGPPIITY